MEKQKVPIHRVEYYLIMTRNGELNGATQGYTSRRNPFAKGHTVWIYFYVIYIRGQIIKTGSRFVFAQVWWVSGVVESDSHGYRASFGMRMLFCSWFFRWLHNHVKTLKVTELSNWNYELSSAWTMLPWNVNCNAQISGAKSPWAKANKTVTESKYLHPRSRTCCSQMPFACFQLTHL